MGVQYPDRRLKRINVLLFATGVMNNEVSVFPFFITVADER